MNNYADEFARQNPKIYFKCNNCEEQFAIPTEKIFREKEITYICKKCNKKLLINTTNVANDLEKQLKELGIIIK